MKRSRDGTLDNSKNCHFCHNPWTSKIKFRAGTTQTQFRRKVVLKCCNKCRKEIVNLDGDEFPIAFPRETSYTYRDNSGHKRNRGVSVRTVMRTEDLRRQLSYEG